MNFARTMAWTLYLVYHLRTPLNRKSERTELSLLGLLLRLSVLNSSRKPDGVMLEVSMKMKKSCIKTGYQLIWGTSILDLGGTMLESYSFAALYVGFLVDLEPDLHGLSSSWRSRLHIIVPASREFADVFAMISIENKLSNASRPILNPPNG